MTRPRADEATVAKIKREKLKLKEEMERLKKDLAAT
jgi:hypothetical protein